MYVFNHIKLIYIYKNNNHIHMILNIYMIDHIPLIYLLTRIAELVKKSLLLCVEYLSAQDLFGHEYFCPHIYDLYFKTVLPN